MSLISGKLEYYRRAGIVTVVGYDVPVESDGKTIRTLLTGFRPVQRGCVTLAYPQIRTVNAQVVNTQARIVIDPYGNIRFYGDAIADKVTFCTTFVAA